MHILIGFLGSLVTLFYLLDRLGIDLGGLNPFYFFRRRAFAKKYGSDPIYSVEDPMHIAALLVIGAAKLDGDLTGEERQTAKALFKTQFSLDEREASQLFGSAAHLLAAPQLLEDQLGKLADRNRSTFSPEQTESVLEMMRQVVNASGNATEAQRAFMERIEQNYQRPVERKGTWA